MLMGATTHGRSAAFFHQILIDVYVRAGTVTKSCKENPPHLALKLMRGPLEASPCDCVLL